MNAVPIRPELRKYYGPEWRRYRETLLALAGHRCAQCGTEHKYLNAAHVHHDPRNVHMTREDYPTGYVVVQAQFPSQFRYRSQSDSAVVSNPEIAGAPEPETSGTEPDAAIPTVSDDQVKAALLSATKMLMFATFTHKSTPR